MNILKFKDSPLDIPDRGPDINFNEKFKGKYAYWIHLKYAVSFDDINIEEYGDLEQSSNPEQLLTTKGIYFIKTENYLDSIDTNTTIKINDISFYVAQNQFAPSSELTIEQIKKFRTWLAETLLAIGRYEDSEEHVLAYYADGMYNNIIHYLTKFGQTSVQLTPTISSSDCGCMGNLSKSYATTPINTCDPVYVYKNNIYKKMVEIFSNIYFWTQFDSEFLTMFKLYIDNIIRCNLTLSRSIYVSNFIDCGCNNVDTQTEMIKLLQQLSKSLQYLIDDKIIGHKNYISDALTNWAKYLYENMEWA